jgi:hypothetical protein
MAVRLPARFKFSKAYIWKITFYTMSFEAFCLKNEKN